MTYLFELNNVKYKDILNIDSLKIQSKKVTCIIGESGSGKTTLLKLLNNLISIDSGEIIFNNSNMDNIDPIDLRRKVVMLGQTSVAFPETIKDNLEIALKYSDKKLLSDSQYKDLLKSVHLNKPLDYNCEKLSGGEKQRLSLARVLILNPEILLLDEPSSALDDETEDLVIKELVKYCCKNDKTLIIVTHSKRIAKEYGDDIIKLSRGKIIKDVIKSG